MLLPPSKSAKSPEKSPATLGKRRKFENFCGWLQPVSDLIRSLFMPPRHLPRGARAGRLELRHASFQPLEARLCLTPVANSDSYHGNMGGTTVLPASVGVLANDTGGSLTAVLVSGPSHGSLTLNSDGSFSYNNTMMYSSDSFTYKAFDGTSYSSAATVTLNLSYNGALPSAYFEGYSMVHDRTLSVSASGVLSNDYDPNSIPLTAVLVSSPSHGSLTLNSNGSLSYTPATHWTGTDSFSYHAYNGSQYSSTITDTINVSNHAPTATGDSYTIISGSANNVSAASGLLQNDSDPDGDTLTASVVSGPSHGTLTLNSDGSFSYTPTPGFLGTDSFVYAASDGVASDNATVSLTTDYSVLSATDVSKVPVDTIHVANQILSDPFNAPITSPLPAGGSGGTTISAAPADGAPATAHNLSLVYDSVLAQPDAVIEANIGLSTNASTPETVTATLTFNGTAQPARYFTMSSLNGTDSHVILSQQVDTSALASGRYPWSLTVTSTHMQSPATVSGYVNVVNDSSSPFGKGWDMPGLYRLFNNSVTGVPSGVLLSTGDASSYYFTAGSGSSYTSPAGAFAFSTLTSVTGGWQLATHDGVTFSFNSSGYLTSRVERTGETTDYTWSSGQLTTITDQFGRAVDLGYTSGLLSSIEDFASNTWTIAHSGSNLTSITEPNPGSGSAPEWEYAYSGNYMSSVTDPNGNESELSLDAFHRLSGTTLPDSSTTGDVSEQDFGYGSTGSGSPANLTVASSVTPTTTDGDGNTSAYQTDQFGDVISETDSAGNTTTITRDSNGLPTVITLPPPTTGASNPATDIYYDSTGDEAYATGAQPTYGTFTYTTDSFGQWATFTDSLGNEWVRTFDSSGNILTDTDPSGSEVSWTYNTYGQPLTMTLPAPNDAVGTVTVDYYYDGYDRLTEILWPDSTNEQFGYNADDFQTSCQDEDGNVTAASLDVLNRVVSVTDAAGGVISTTYDNDNNVLTTTDALGNVTSDEFNSMNELVEQTLPAPTTGGTSPVLAWTYSADGQELTYTDSLGNETSYSYNDLNELTQETLPAPSTGATAPTIEYAYNNLGQQVTETDALAGVTTTAYGNTDISQVTSVTAPAPSGSGSGPTTSYFYDTDGRQDQVENALAQYTTTTFTLNGQTASVEDNLGDTTTDTYGNGGELLTTTDALSHSTSDEYDDRYRLIQTADANSRVTSITLDGVGNTTALVDSDGNETDWTFSPTNLPLTESNSLGTTTITYDLDSDVTSIVDADGRERDFVYNNDQQLTAENWMSGTTVVAAMDYAYDLSGELTSASDANSAYAFAYNGDAQVTSTDNSGTPNVPDVVLANAYDLMGDVTSQSATIAGTADFLNSYTYNADQQLTSVTQQDQTGGNVVSPKEIDYDHNALGLVTDTWAYNTLSGPREDVLHGASSYDGGGRLTGLTYTSNAGADTIDDFGWAYNAANLVTSFTSIDGTADYGYDPTNQLTSATYTTAPGGHQPANESFSFDANGNPDSTGYTTGSDNLLTSDGTFNYQHDADGNTTVRTRISDNYATDYRTTYTWDYRNRLTDVDYYDNNGVLTTHVNFIYDVFNNLIGEEDDDTGDGVFDHEEFYVVAVSPQAPAAGQPTVEAAQPLLEFNAGATLTERFLVAPDPTGAYAVMAQGSVTSLNQGDVVIWMADDRQGTPRDIANNSGTPVNHIVFSELGADVYESDPSVTHWSGFAGGHLSAAAQLVLDGLRWYDPNQARWLNFDPTLFHGGDANLARYNGNDPTNGLDRTGEISNTAIAAAVVFPWLLPAILAADVLPAVAFAPPLPPGAGQPVVPAIGHIPGVVAPGLLAQQQIVAAIALPPLPMPPAPVAGPGAAIAGPLGGGVTGAGIGGVMGAGGAAIGGTIVVLAATALVAAGLIATAPAWGTVLAAIGAGALAGAVLGGVTGAIVGANQPNIGAGALAAWDEPAVWIAPFCVGLAVGGLGPLGAAVP